MLHFLRSVIRMVYSLDVNPLLPHVHVLTWCCIVEIGKFFISLSKANENMLFAKILSNQCGIIDQILMAMKACKLREVMKKNWKIEGRIGYYFIRFADRWLLYSTLFENFLWNSIAPKFNIESLAWLEKKIEKELLSFWKNFWKYYCCGLEKICSKIFVCYLRLFRWHLHTGRLWWLG